MVQKKEINANKSPRSKKLNAPIIAIIIVLLCWGGFLAWGAIRQQADLEFGKPLIIAGAFAMFALVWGVLLLFRNSSDPRKDKKH